MDTVIGICSFCKGAVVIPGVWYGVQPPVATCQNCGAREKRSNLPEIEMEPSPYLNSYEESLVRKLSRSHKPEPKTGDKEQK